MNMRNVSVMGLLVLLSFLLFFAAAGSRDMSRRLDGSIVEYSRCLVFVSFFNIGRRAGLIFHVRVRGKMSYNTKMYASPARLYEEPRQYRIDARTGHATFIILVATSRSRRLRTASNLRHRKWIMLSHLGTKASQLDQGLNRSTVTEKASSTPPVE